MIFYTRQNACSRAQLEEGRCRLSEASAGAQRRLMLRSAVIALFPKKRSVVDRLPPMHGGGAYPFALPFDQPAGRSSALGAQLLDEDEYNSA